MKTIEINNFLMNIGDIQAYIENNEYAEIAACERKNADIKVIVKDKNINNKRVQYTCYYRFI